MSVIKVVSWAIKRQVEIDRELRANGVIDLVGDYGELLAHMALGGDRTLRTTEGHDIEHPQYKRVQVKTRKFALLRNGKIRKEGRAVGFKREKPNQFDWLCHIVLNVDYSVVGATLVAYSDVWPVIMRLSQKVPFNTSSRLSSSIDVTAKIKEAAGEVAAATATQQQVPAEVSATAAKPRRQSRG